MGERTSTRRALWLLAALELSATACRPYHLARSEITRMAAEAEAKMMRDLELAEKEKSERQKAAELAARQAEASRQADERARAEQQRARVASGGGSGSTGGGSGASGTSGSTNGTPSGGTAAGTASSGAGAPASASGAVVSGGSSGSASAEGGEVGVFTKWYYFWSDQPLQYRYRTVSSRPAPGGGDIVDLQFEMKVDPAFRCPECDAIYLFFSFAQPGATFEAY